MLLRSEECQAPQAQYRRWLESSKTRTDKAAVINFSTWELTLTMLLLLSVLHARNIKRVSILIPYSMQSATVVNQSHSIGIYSKLLA